MRLLPVVGLTAVLAVVAAYFLWPGTTTPKAEPEAAPEGSIDPPAAPSEGVRPAPTTGKLVIRVKTSDGSPVPEGTTAGYLDQGVPRMRKAAKDGTFPFTDAPVRQVPLVATANAPGYTADRVEVVLIAGVDAAEPVVTLTPVK